VNLKSSSGEGSINTAFGGYGVGSGPGALASLPLGGFGTGNGVMNNIMTELCPSDEKDAVKEIINATVFMPVSKGWKYSTRKKTPSWKYYYVHSDYRTVSPYLRLLVYVELIQAVLAHD
jgi:hypothetical protein